VRILVTFAGGSGHFLPLQPIARAAVAAGHDVVVACQPVMLPTVAAAGFHAIDTSGVTFRTSPGRTALAKPDLEKDMRALAAGYAGRTAKARAALIHAHCMEWRPDVLLRDEMDFGAAIAAERLALPHASVVVIAAGGFVRREIIAPPLDALRAEHGLAPDPELTTLSRYLVLAPIPPRYRDPADPLPPTSRALRPFATNDTVNAPGWLADLPRPIVYFTLGTVFNVESGDLFERVLAGLHDLPVGVVATVGKEINPEEIGPHPPHVRIERYVAQSSLLPHCSLVVSHGGSGSVIGALAQGLPMVLIPMGADQPLNAKRCLQLGVAQVLDAIAVTPANLRAAVSTVLAEPRYRREAERMKSEIASLPDPAYGVALLERLAKERRPILAG
jgi:UDP:flavonoid glycosyltransferase YjiC (YdhE family)